MPAPDRYDFVPRMLKSLFTWGLGVSAVFFIFWYYGGMHVWGFFMSMLLKVLVLFQVPISYETTEGAIVFAIQSGGPSGVQIGYYVNQWNLAIAEVFIMFCLWLPDRKKDALRFIAICLGILICYQMVAVFLNIGVQALGPDVANKMGVMWDYEDSLLFVVLKKCQLFDTFIARYWVGFPVYGLAVFIHLFVLSRLGVSKKKDSLSKVKKKARSSKKSI
ncbi:MAG: hypothetical protein CSA81_06590 [Acidobacteria bacterium]|nr:MAG: hypothetical protein CSA81_06590 [Acidobacteriota bacterium]